jgi:nicotinate-nucleotide adenylyltransferase
MRIGLLGGTFNPIHRCHLTIAAETKNLLGLDRIVFIPAGEPPHKPRGSLVSGYHRFEMVRRAIASTPEFLVSDIEVARGAVSYSIETVQILRTEFGPAVELFFLIGLDAFLDFPSWKRAPDLLRACHFVVLARPHTAFVSLLSIPMLPPLPQESLADLDAQRVARVDVPVPGGTALTLLRISPCDISSSTIRQHLRRGRSVSHLLPPPVESYIMQQGLYQEESDRTGV